MSIAFLGTGLLGSGFVESLLGRGHSVQVWNRTRAKAERLAALGAVVFDHATDAVRGAQRVHICLSDDGAVDAVLDAIVGALEKDAWVVDHTTTSPLGTARRYERARREGFRFAHAPVFMGPPMARAAKGIMLLSGPEANEAALRPALSEMTGELVYLGAREDLAASFKLFGNAMLITIMGGLADILAMGRSLGIEPDTALKVFDKFNPFGGLQMRGQRMAKNDFQPPGFELSMARKDLRLMMETSDQLQIIPAIAQLLDRAIAEGHGQEDVGVIAEIAKGSR